MRRDPYRVLGVPPTATAEQLHDAYRQLIKLHHPDRNGGSPESTARFQEIQAAYEELRNRPRGASAARGIHGQLLAVDHERRTVTVVLSSWPAATDPHAETAQFALLAR